MHAAKVRFSQVGRRVEAWSIPLPERYMSVDKPFVITIVGAESSGKTTLARRLSNYFDCPWVPEYAREYLEGLGRAYNEEDLEIIAKRQLEEINRQLAIGKEQRAEGKAQGAKGNEQLAISNRQFGSNSDAESLFNFIKSKIVNRQSSIVIVDGGMMTLRMWARIKYNMTIPIVEDALREDVTDLYLLCRPLKEWEPDPYREAPSIVDRSWIYNQYLEELTRSGTWIEIVDAKENEKPEGGL